MSRLLDYWTSPIYIFIAILCAWSGSESGSGHNTGLRLATSDPALLPQRASILTIIYSLCFKIKVTFGYKLTVCYEIKITFGEISLNLHQTNWNVARNNVHVVADELPSQVTVDNLFNN